MASLTFTQFSSIPRWHSNWPFFLSTNSIQLQHLRLRNTLVLKAVSRKKFTETSVEKASSDNELPVENKTNKTTKRASTRTRKRAVSESPEDNSAQVVNNNIMLNEESVTPLESSEDSKKTKRRTRRKAASTSVIPEEEVTEKKVTRRSRTKKKSGDDIENKVSGTEHSELEGDSFVANAGDDSELDIEIGKDGDEDISFTYGWPPLVCCFGAAQHEFVPSGRPANRLVDYEMQERRKDALWIPEKFVRAPGGCASNVALVLSKLGGKVAFMGKLGDDDYGQSLLLYLNENNVQTRSIRIDSKRVTAVSHMKIGKRSGLRMTCVKPCAEDSLSRSEINLDVLKEAKMFYFNTFSLLDRNMRSTALEAAKISKKLGGTIFYDLNLPLSLWHSGEETKMFIDEVWKLADIIEVTKQELEFLCGINPSEKFDTKDNDRSKFVHYEREVIAPLWHENLKVLFVTNGTSKIHYYTKEHNGAILGMEDAPITPFTCDMSASGDGIVAALMRMLTVQPHLMTDEGYLKHTIKYAIDCGVIDQWRQARVCGFPPKEGMDVAPDINGLRSITEREYRTLVPVS